ncbi:MAG: hypothetical protein OCD76_17290 [Reichenbachiella sp.]
MNEFLDKHSYRLYQGTNLVMIRHYNSNAGCVHAIFISVIAALFSLSLFLYYFEGQVTMLIIMVLASMAYILEFDRRSKQASRLFIDFSDESFQIKKGKNKEVYDFQNVVQVVCISESLGGYASSNKSTTEEFKREINVLFKDGFVLTAFSFISDSESTEPEVDILVSWLEKVIKR